MDILMRRQGLRLNDPRCYNGAYFDAEYVYGGWEILEAGVPETKVQERLDFWIGLNNYAVSQRGESARTLFKAE